MTIKSLIYLLATTWLVASPPGTYSQTLVGLGSTPEASGFRLCGTSFALRNVSVTRFTFEIKPSTPLQDLFPLPPLQSSLRPPWLVKDLTQVPEILFQSPLQFRRRNRASLEAGTDLPENEKFKKELLATREQIALTFAKINHVNKDDVDRFITMLVENRRDLAGLPFLKGNACRMSKEISREFVEEAFPARAFELSV